MLGRLSNPVGKASPFTIPQIHGRQFHTARRIYNHYETLGVEPDAPQAAIKKFVPSYLIFTTTHNSSIQTILQPLQNAPSGPQPFRPRRGQALRRDIRSLRNRRQPYQARALQPRHRATQVYCPPHRLALLLLARIRAFRRASRQRPE